MEYLKELAKDVETLILKENLVRIQEEFTKDIEESEIAELIDSFMQNSMLMINDNDKEL
jgi:hypothetical protein